MGKKFVIKQLATDRKDSSLKLYFREISKYPILSPEEEIKLTQKVKEGDNKAIRDLINANLRFVISVAKQYQGKGLDLVDLIQEGNCGLIKAAQDYDPSKGFRFISYAVWWIRQSILKALFNKGKIIRVPTNQLLNNVKINKVNRQYEAENEIPPSTNELENMTNLSAQKIANATATYYKTISLEAPFKEADSSSLIDVFPNKDSKLPNENIMKLDLNKELELILSKMSNRESDIVRLIFGIDVNKMSFDEIANRFGVGEERIKQLLRLSLRNMKEKFGDKLIEFL